MRFTALLDPEIITRISSTTTTAGRVKLSKSRMNDTCSDAGVWPRSSGRVSASTPKTTATSVCPANFALLRSPRLRCLAILM